MSKTTSKVYNRTPEAEMVCGGSTEEETGVSEFSESTQTVTLPDAWDQARAYVEAQDYLNDENRNAAGNGYVAGWRDRGEVAPADNNFVEGLKAEIKQQRQWKYEIAADKNRLEEVVESFLREAGRGNLSHCNGQAAIDEMMAEAKKALKFCTTCDGSGKETEVSRPDKQGGGK